MRTFRFNPRGQTPIVAALITGPKRTRKVRLIFDTGAETTQLNRTCMRAVGYSQEPCHPTSHVVGAGGIESTGFVVSLRKMFVLGSRAEEFDVGVFKMELLEMRHIDGLLGWDVIRALHLEMNGPQGLLRVF